MSVAILINGCGYIGAGKPGLRGKSRFTNRPDSGQAIAVEGTIYLPGHRLSIHVYSEEISDSLCTRQGLLQNSPVSHPQNWNFRAIGEPVNDFLQMGLECLGHHVMADES